MGTINIYTDGSCNKGIGGYSFIILKDELLHIGYGGAINCTNNQMELLAPLLALTFLKTKEVKTCKSCNINFECTNTHPSLVQCDKKTCDFTPPRFDSQHKSIKIYSDSKYVVDGMNDHVYTWKLKNFAETHSGQPLKNNSFWYALDYFNKIHAPEWNWIKGHVGHEYNELADSWANVGRNVAKMFLSSKTLYKKTNNHVPVFDVKDLASGNDHDNSKYNLLALIENPDMLVRPLHILTFKAERNKWSII